MGECLLHCCLALLQSKDTSPHPVVIEGGIKPGEWHGWITVERATSQTGSQSGTRPSP